MVLVIEPSNRTFEQQVAELNVVLKRKFGSSRTTKSSSSIETSSEVVSPLSVGSATTVIVRHVEPMKFADMTLSLQCLLPFDASVKLPLICCDASIRKFLRRKECKIVDESEQIVFEPPGDASIFIHIIQYLKIGFKLTTLPNC